MNQTQIHRLEMMRATNDYLDTHTAVWSVIPVIANHKNHLAETIDEIRAASEDEETQKIFVGSTLEHLRIQVAEKMDILDDTLEAYAEDTHNSELLYLAANSKSDYLDLPLEEFEEKVKNVITLLENNVANMADYGLNQEQIEDAKLTFSSFQDRNGMPRTYQHTHRVASQIDELIEEATSVLGKLDKVMKRFKRSSPSFYHGYDMVRSMADTYMAFNR